MTALLLILALQAPLDDEVDMLRARMRSVEVEVAIMKDRLQQSADREARHSDLELSDVIGAVIATVTLLGGGKWALGKVQK